MSLLENQGYICILSATNTGTVPKTDLFGNFHNHQRERESCYVL